MPIPNDEDRKSDEKLKGFIARIMSKICPDDMSDKEMAEILGVSEDRVKVLWRQINAEFEKNVAGTPF